jgi:hypothetical protein
MKDHKKKSHRRNSLTPPPDPIIKGEKSKKHRGVWRNIELEALKSSFLLRKDYLNPDKKVSKKKREKALSEIEEIVRAASGGNDPKDLTQILNKLKKLRQRKDGKVIFIHMH